MLRILPAVLAQLSALNARILMSHYEGFSCGELAERFALPVDSVKVRVHRSRGRVKALIEERLVRGSGELRG